MCTSAVVSNVFWAAYMSKVSVVQSGDFENTFSIVKVGGQLNKGRIGQ